MTEPTLYERIYAVVRQIPRGRVATYGQVALLAGMAGHARQVGYALHSLPEGSPVPWQRVVNREGRISLRTDPAAGERQRLLLAAEGVRFDAAGRIDLEKAQWRGRGRQAGPVEHALARRRCSKASFSSIREFHGVERRRGMDQEHRKRTRVPVHLGVTVSLDGKEIGVTIVNISLTGILCGTSPLFRPGAPCRVTIPLGDEARVVIDGKILRVDERETAIGFAAMDEESFSHLRHLVAYNLGDAGPVEKEIGTPAFEEPATGGSRA